MNQAKKNESTHLERVVSLFDEQAARYSSRYHRDSLGGYGFSARKDKVLELVDGTGGRALDVGCGPGIMVPELINRGFEFWGVDASPKMIEECYCRFGQLEGAHFSVGDAIALDFPPGFFDLVICMGVIERIERYEQAIREMHRVLRKGGTCIITFPNLHSPNEAWRKFAYNPAVDLLKRVYSHLAGESQPAALSSFVRLHEQSDSADIVAAHFGDVAEIEFFNFNVFLSPLDLLLPGFATRVAKRLEYNGPEKLRWLGTGFAVKAIKSQMT